MSEYKCPHCEYYMWEGKEFYECDIQDKVSRLEQENKDLKKYIELMDEPVVDMDIALDYAELKAENERLKAELEPYKHPDVITLLTNWRTGELDRTHNKIANERDKYHQTLREIKEIAEKYDNLTYPVSSIRLSQEILRKITKAEEE